ncbi:MAG: ribonucleotide reductase N-terminal alpha domain-containing protein, partial [Maricaulaceae bacterium]
MTADVKDRTTQTIKSGNITQLTVIQDKARDELLTDFGKRTLVDRYLIGEESYQDMFSRVAKAYADDLEHAQRLYDYMSKLYFMPA